MYIEEHFATREERDARYIEWREQYYGVVRYSEPIESLGSGNWETRYYVARPNSPAGEYVDESLEQLPEVIS